MFVNISSYPSKQWGINLMSAVHALGQSKVADLPPPNVPDNAEAAEVKAIAASTVVCGVKDGDAVLVDCPDVEMGHYLIDALKKRGRVTVYALVGSRSAFRRFRRIT